MSIRLIKTIGGSDGAPRSCNDCGAINFLKIGIAWSCSECGAYFPIDLTTLGCLKQDLSKLKNLHRDFKRAIDSLERLTKK